jgi:hypothetical protein
MALGTPTRVGGIDISIPPYRAVPVTFALDSSYPTGGTAVTAQPFGLEVLRGMMLMGSTYTAGYLQYNTSTGKLQAFTVLADGAWSEVANGTNLSAYTATFLVVGES